MKKQDNYADGRLNLDDVIPEEDRRICGNCAELQEGNGICYCAISDRLCDSHDEACCDYFINRYTGER